MPLPVFSQLYDRIDVHSSAFRYLVAGLAVLFALRVWSSTPSLRVRRVLHGRTVVISVGEDCIQQMALLLTLLHRAVSPR